MITKSGGKEYAYVKLIENYREGKKVKQRVIANLGNLEDLTPEKVEGLIASLERVCGVKRARPTVEAKKVLRWGEVLALRRVWEVLGLGEVMAGLLGEENAPAVEFLAVSRALNPGETRSFAQWGQEFYWPGAAEGGVQFPRLEVVGDGLAAAGGELEKALYRQIGRVFGRGNTLYCLVAVAEVMPAARAVNASHPYARYFFAEAAQEEICWGVLAGGAGLPFGYRLFTGTGEAGLRQLCREVGELYGGQCLFVGDRQPATNLLLETVVAHDYPYLVRCRALSEREKQLCREEIARGRAGFAEAAGGLLFREVPDGGARYLLCCTPATLEEKGDPLAGVTLLRTNSALGGRELVLAYWELAGLAGRAARISRFTSGEQNLGGELAVVVLGALLERALEKLLQRAGLTVDAAQALEILGELKMIVGLIDGMEVRLATRTERAQAEILRALGIEDLQALSA
ncbi:hypothetical protein [Desulfovirgula thermocuniculi]|uniref:hypothetical protein n=1 Tax=Desulfovirgula thermocuniculi TaxID=348842 RepID=UPI001B7F84C7|nr:hypothetical protein [Desulfovirgula thermocuniculi]